MRSARCAAVTLALLLLAAPARAGTAEGTKLLAEGRHAEAADEFQKTLATSSGDRAALLGLARATTEGRLYDRYDRATALLGDALRAKADDREVRLAFGNLFLARSVDDERFRADAQDQFARLLRADAADEEAAVGLARMYYLGADYARGAETLDALLAKKPKAPLALYWKGVLRYDEATQAFRQTPTMDERVKALFQGALASLTASVEGDPTRFDAWMKLGYSAQYLMQVDPAQKAIALDAYLKALAIDGESDLPMRGLSALHANDSQGWAALLARLAKERSTTPVVLYYQGYSLQSQGKGEEAEKAYRGFVAASRHPALGWYAIGEILRERGDAEGARKAYVASLKADPTHAQFQAAVDQLTQPLLEKSSEAVGDVGKAKALLARFDEIIALAPKSYSARNNVAFFLREAYDRTGKKERSLLDACVAHYVAASELIGEFQPGYLQTVPYRDRHAYAQVLNDTGLMFHYYPPVEDLRKAEKYYRAALEWTEDGYWDAYTNLMKVLDTAERHDEALDLALACAEGIKTESGEPQETFRATCRGDAERLAKKLGREEPK